MPGAIAWQPLTPRGVAAFARATVGRLLIVQFIFTIPAVVAVVLVVSHAWFPSITEAIRALPAGSEIRGGRLDWRGENPARLSEGNFLSLIVDLEHAGAARNSASHIQIEFGRQNVRVFSLLGFTDFPYPQGWIVSFQKADLEPWWGSRQPSILAITVLVVIVGLMLSWAVLATIYTLPAWLGGLYGNRDLTFLGSWRLAGAAVLPGSLFMTTAVFAYGCGGFDVLRLAMAGVIHILIGWTYVILAIMRLPAAPEVVAAPKENPFVPAPEKAGKPNDNPFGAPPESKAPDKAP